MNDVDINAVEKYLRSLQLHICSSLEDLDGKAKFQHDRWDRPGGGGRPAGRRRKGTPWRCQQQLVQLHPHGLAVSPAGCAAGLVLLRVLSGRVATGPGTVHDVGKRRWRGAAS